MKKQTGLATLSLTLLALPSFALECRVTCSQYETPSSITSSGYYNILKLKAFGKTAEEIISKAPLLCQKEGARQHLSALQYTHELQCPKLHPVLTHDGVSDTTWSVESWEYNDDPYFASLWKN